MDEPVHSAAGAQSPYQYQSLGPRQIRLIRILSTEELSISLLHVSLDDVPEYVAVSYTWDNQLPEYPCSVHSDVSEGTLWLTRNCTLMLKHFRKKSEELVWIDAICINQGSIADKNTQVPLMAAIYGKAMLCLAWLGDSNMLYAGMQCYKAVLEELNASEDDDIDARDLVYMFSRMRDNEAQNVGDAVSDNLLPICIWSPITSPYFLRIWTLQEMTIPRHVLVTVRDLVFRLDDFMRVAIIINEHMSTLSQSKTELAFCFDARWVLKQVHEFRDAYHPEGNFKVLNPLLDPKVASSIVSMGSWRRRCFDPRDQIYGLYGLFAQSGLDHLPPVDYSKPIADVYADMIKATVTFENSLTILSEEFSGLHEVQGLPSWVPDWSIESTNELVSCTIEGSFAAAPPTPLDVSFPTPKHISLTCKLVDTLHDVSTLSPGPSWDVHGLEPSERVDRAKTSLGAYREWLSMMSYSKECSIYSDNSVTMAFYRTLTFGTDVETKTAPCREVWGVGVDLQPFAEAFEVWSMIIDMKTLFPIRNVLDSVRDFIADKIGGLDELVSDYNMSLRDCWTVPELQIALAFKYPTRISIGDNYLAVDEAKLTRLQSVLDRTTIGRKFFFTERGYMGLGYREILAGDKVFLVAGMPIPVICRAVGDEWRFVAPAYVHGMMMGELWDDNEITPSVYTFA